jgi:hypothetical protein
MHFSFKALQTIADTLKRMKRSVISFVDACTRCAWFVTKKYMSRLMNFDLKN